jgi:hypothetical protein
MPTVSTKGLHQTNWNKNANEHAAREKQPFMMGEGVGNNLGLDNSKAVPGKPIGWHDEQKRLLAREAAAERAKQIPKKMFAKAIESRYRSHHLPKKIQNGDVLIGQRVFLVDFLKKGSDKLLNNLGLPEGAHVAQTEFGHLVIVPVLETDEALARGIDIKQEKGCKDVEGRPCWVAAEIKEKIEAVFGHVRWTRPLTIKEVSQFGVEVI